MLAPLAHRLLAVPIVSAIVFALTPALVLADDEVSDAPPDPSRVWGGELVETCGWPTTVAVTSGGGLCSGTLVHPELVIYAAHCGAGNKTITFGESTNSLTRVGTTQCMTNPDYNDAQGTDWAWCRLEGRVNMPLTPIGMGCELEEYYHDGAPIALVGFGMSESGGAGRKHWGMSTIGMVFPAGDCFDVGGNGQVTICSGDSGGSAFIQYADGSWHAYGIHSTKSSENCDQAPGTVALAAAAVPWIEESSGLDVTPCYDGLTGEWDPGPDCGGFLAGDGATGHGTWSDGCAGTPVSGMSSTCGPPFDAEPDDNPPVLEITSPEDYAEIEPDTAIAIEIDASDDSGYITSVQIKINGSLQDLEDWDEPWGFEDVVFPEGEYEIIAVGEDPFGNVGESDPVRIFVGMDAPDPPDPTGTDGTGTDGDSGTGPGQDDGASSGGGGGGAADGRGDAGGCGCRATGREDGALWALGLLAAIGACRRRIRER